MSKACGTRSQYLAGCRCDECRHAEALYKRRLRDNKINGGPARPTGAGAVEMAIWAEVEGLEQAESRPTLVQAAVAMARILDNPRAPGPQPQAAKQLADLMNQLRKGADARKSRLASVKAMTSANAKTG